MFQSRAGFSVEALPSMSPSSTLLPPLISGRLSPASHTLKLRRYAAAFVHSDYDFAPVIFETSGALNKEGETVLKQIIRFASKREGITHTVYAARAWARLCSSSFQQILNRHFVDCSEVADVFDYSCSSDEPSMT